MKLNGKIKKSFVIACALLMFLSSCKKEESSTSTTKGMMNGTLTFNLPEFIFSGETLELEATGINVPLKQNIKWFIPMMYGSADTVFANPIRVQFPDSLGTFHISCMALADSYWIVSTYKETTTIDTSLFYGSLEGREFDLDSYIIDPRDGRRYFTTEVGNLEWFAENLAYEGAGAYYKTSPVMQHLFGRYYSWEEATGGVSADGLAEGPQGVCPPGWHIPTNTDWEDLGMWLNDGEPVAFDDKWPELGSRASVEVYLNYEKIWSYSPDNLHENSVLWNAMPAGYSHMGHKTFNDTQKYGFWWSATQYDDSRAYYRYIFSDAGTFPSYFGDKSEYGFNVRCVRLAE